MNQRTPLSLLAGTLIFISASAHAVECTHNDPVHGWMPHGCINKPAADKDGNTEVTKANNPMIEPLGKTPVKKHSGQNGGGGSQQIDQSAVDLANHGGTTLTSQETPGVSAHGVTHTRGSSLGGGGETRPEPRDMTRDQALALFHEREQAIREQYGQEMGGKFSVIGTGVVDDIRDFVNGMPPDKRFSSARFKAQLDMLDAQLALASAAETPGLDPKVREQRLQAAQSKYDALHNVLQALPVIKPEGGSPNDGGGWVGRDPMERLHALYTKEYREYKPAPDPTNPSGNVPGPIFPGGGLPPPSHIGDMIKSDPGNSNNWSLDAKYKLSQGDKAGALSSLDKAIAIGGNAEALGLRGAMRLEDKNYDGAYQDAKKALELKPGDKDLMGLLKSAEGRTTPGLASSSAGGSGASGGAYENRGAGGFAGFDPGKTRDIPGMTTASTIASNQKLEEARRALAMGDFQAAIALAQRALELNPSNAAAHGFLSSVYARTGDYKRAIASASAGLALAPRDAALLNNKAFAENRSKLYRDALGTSNGAIEADSRNPYSYANRAYAYGGLGDKSSMMSDINRAAGIDPRFEKAAADAAALQLPSNADILFMFPGENPDAPTAAAPARGKSFGLVVGAGILGGLLLALGLLSTVLAPLKDSVVSAFTKVTRHGPSVHALEEDSTPAVLPEPAAAGVIRGQYEIIRQIGAGGMGMVYEGTDRSLGRRVAIKKMRDELRINPRERERFVIEAKTVASLHHANIVDIYAIAEEGEDVYLVFEYVDGKTIHDLVQAKGRLNASDSLRVTQAMGDALTYAHAHGVIHRDMKPSNVMLTSDGQIKVMDFGIARMAKDALTRYSMTNNVVGTPPYMAPEQEQGIVRKESDVYSLAICAYEMLTGKLPFIGIGAGMLMNKINMSYIPPSRAIAGLPVSLDAVFLKAFQADPDQRYHAPQEFVAAFEGAFGAARSSGHPV